MPEDARKSVEGVFVSLVISGLQLLSGAQTMESRQLLERVVLKLAQADVRILLGRICCDPLQH